MKTTAAIEARRAVKHYDAKFVMPEQDAQELLRLARLSPTAFNIQNWRFVRVQNADLRQKIRAVAWDQSQVTDASLLLVLCADLKAWQKKPERYWRDAPQEVSELMVGAIGGYYQDKEQVQRDEAMRSCGIAAQTLMLSAKALGYDSCPMDGFDFGAVGDLIALPDDHVITMMVAIGKATKEAWARPGQLAGDEVVINDTFDGDDNSQATS